MNTMRLIQALAFIQLHDKTLSNPYSTITKIEFADGSGYKFNYTVLTQAGSQTKFIDLKGRL